MDLQLQGGSVPQPPSPLLTLFKAQLHLKLPQGNCSTKESIQTSSSFQEMMEDQSVSKPLDPSFFLFYPTNHEICFLKKLFI